MGSGQMIESALVGRDSVVGGGAALDDRDALHKAVIQVAGVAMVLGVDDARRIARDSEEFRTAIMRHEQLILAQAQQSAACNATHDLQQRLARWLLRVRDATGSHNIALTQEYMADMLGVQRTSVSVVAHALQEAGLIRYRRGHVSIERSQALEAKACECYAAVRNRYEEILKAPASAPSQQVPKG
jgi:CRP-like cAMP-binding protein